MDGSLEYEVKKYENYKRAIKYFLAGSGIWPNFQPHPWYFRIFLSFCSAFASGSTFVGILVFFVKYVRSIIAWARGIGLLIAFFSAFVKVLVLRRYEKDLMSLNSSLTLKFEEDLKDPGSRKHLLAHFSTFSKFFYVYVYTVGSSLLFLSILPLFMVKHGKYLRMYPQYIPFSYEPGGIVHWIIYAFETTSGCYLWCMTCGVDSLLGLYVLNMVGELRLLAARFRDLRSGGNYKESIKGCIDTHTLLMGSRYTLERVFGFLAIYLTVTCAIALCALVFQITHLQQISVFRVCYIMAHCFLKLMQAYSYAWYGNIVFDESENCLMSVYEAYWPGSGDSRLMIDVLIVLSQKPIVFRAMGCMNLRLDMFMKVVNTTVSYFFLLQTLEEKSN